MKEAVLRMYLDYVNEFLTVSRFAEYYGITDRKAIRVLVIGSRLNSRRTK